ncbi:hypothetical protein ACFQMM_02440 [Saliphagus sp. GCM10025308]
MIAGIGTIGGVGAMGIGATKQGDPDQWNGPEENGPKGKSEKIISNQNGTTIRMWTGQLEQHVRITGNPHQIHVIKVYYSFGGGPELRTYENPELPFSTTDGGEGIYWIEIYNENEDLVNSWYL